MNRRSFLKQASAGAAVLAAGSTRNQNASGAETSHAPDEKKKAYKYRIAFGAWINDMRTEPLPVENWPAPQFDDQAVESVIRALDVQAAAGFNMLDAWGVFATYGWPVDITSAVDGPRRERIHKMLKAQRERNITPVFGLGTYSWGYDKIIAAHPDLAGKNPDGTSSPHAMCDANPKAFDFVRKIIDFGLGEFDFGAVHLESCDLGCCWCPRCAGGQGVVGYNTQINQKTADYIKSKWPDKTVYVITINWVPPGKHMTADEKARVLELGRHVDCIFDQGHNGYHIAEAERQEFIEKLHCAYGTSGHLWMYPDARWDRESYFLPYTRRTGEAIKKQFDDGVRGCLYYQGPVTNPGNEMMMAFGGRMLADTTRNIEDVRAEILEKYYRPRDAGAMNRLSGVFQTAEESYFSQWSAELFQKVWGIPVPGEFKLDQRLFGTTPGPATYLKEPCLDARGRKEYRKGLVRVLTELPKLDGHCDDGGRLARIRRSVIITLNMLNTVSYCAGEEI